MSDSVWTNKRVLVTGAAGLLGPWLLKLLVAKQAHPVAIVRDRVPDSIFFASDLMKSVDLVYGDVRDFSLLVRVLNEFEIDAVFHLGAQAIVGIANRSPLSTFQSNIEGTWNVLEACRLSPWVKKIVVASSDKAYGAQPVLPYTEEMPLQGRYPYDVSKSCTDLIAQSYYHTYRLPVCITRCGNFFGPGDLHFNRIVPGTIWSVLDGIQPIIRTDGSLMRDYIYVKDVADAYVVLAEKMDDPHIHGESFNFSTDHPFTVREIVEEIMTLMGCHDRTPLVKGEKTHEIPAQHLSSRKARTVLQWTPAYGVRRGLEETILWYREYHSTKRSAHSILNHDMHVNEESL